MKKLALKALKFNFFTGKGGVGKTTISSSFAAGLAGSGKKVLLISTDPASNLDEVFQAELNSQPSEINGMPGLFAMNINPIEAAAEYRERMVAPYRGVLPDEAVVQMEEQLSGACSVEISGFNEFTRYVGDESLNSEYDHIVLDTAPTGHTLRLLNLPSAWNDFINTNQTGSSCLGPVSGLRDQKILYDKALAKLKNPAETLLVLVARPELMSFTEAERAGKELKSTGLGNQYLVINGIFTSNSDDMAAKSFTEKSGKLLNELPPYLKKLDSSMLPFYPYGIIGADSLLKIFNGNKIITDPDAPEILRKELAGAIDGVCDWETLFIEFEKRKNGVIMAMGKGGVGKTAIASLIAAELSSRGLKVLLTTTDPASHVAETIGENLPGLTVERIDPKAVTENYVNDVKNKSRNRLSEEDMALLGEELKSPCIEEIAVFQAFAQTVALGSNQIIVLDTAPTGHTLLLLDTTEAYYREIKKSSDDIPREVKNLMPLIRDRDYTKILLVTLAEATPIHEAAGLQADLNRAGIETFGWVINRSFSIAGSSDPLFCSKGLNELQYIKEVTHNYSKKTVICPWLPENLKGKENLKKLIKNIRIDS